MAFCKQCGTQVEEGKAFCPSCGTAIEVQQEQPKADPINNVLNTADTTAEYSAEDIEKNKVLALFAYLGILFLIPLLAAKDSKYAQFHARQGIVLFITAIVVSIISGIITLIPFLGWIVLSLVEIAIAVLVIIGIVNAVQGKAKELPIIGGFAKKIFKK